MQDFEFKRHFRLTRSTFEWLCCEIIPHLRREITGPGIVGLAWEQKVGASLWFLATGECFRSIGNRFGMGESTFSYALRDFINVIVTKFLAEKIVFPNTESEINEITNGFKGTGRILNVIGAIDGSHIPIKAPHLFPVDYFNRKGFYSIVLQAVVDHKKSFLDICVGWPGSTHDSRILVNSNLYNNWLIVPYKDIGRGLIQKQTYFNHKHSQTRIKVEQAFGLLKGKWRCLLHSLETRFFTTRRTISEYHDTGTDVNSETNVNETSEGNAIIRNAICDLLWNNHQRRYLNTNDN
ncbi:protein ANTAGONIST OF LIKE HETEROCHROMATIN PROTEIN 1-like [Rhizophagus irregularis DAOM 181602=DAOM 197198]|nr:protein ANTAGONIST OF LIKE HETEROCHROMATIN PROTEIN 1-like [Rhizophagus irregularis DAOM 181602=DAOM 197198]